MSNVAKRADFGGNWEEIVQDWCLGNSLSIAPQVAWDAFGVLERLWAERLDEVLNSSQRGLALVVQLVDDGLTIAACEHLAGFNTVFKRWKDGQSGARSELRFAAALVGLRYSPTLEPSHKGNVLDAVISVGGQNVYFEVAAPEYADVVQQAFGAMRALSKRLAEENPGANISIHLLTEPLPNVCHRIADYVRSLGPPTKPDAGVLHGVARVRIAPIRARLPGVQLPGEAARSPLVCSAMAVRKDAVWGRANVCLPIGDDRAETLLRRELSHFHHQTTNVVVLDVSRVIGGMKSWVPLVKRRFQPKINRRCGAVVLLRSVNSVFPPAMNLNTLVLSNQHAYRPVPTPLLDQLGDLPNWWQI